MLVFDGFDGSFPIPSHQRAPDWGDEKRPVAAWGAIVGGEASNGWVKVKPWEPWDLDRQEQHWDSMGRVAKKIETNRNHYIIYI